jgi:hypothetical protein
VSFKEPVESNFGHEKTLTDTDDGQLPPPSRLIASVATYPEQFCCFFNAVSGCANHADHRRSNSGTHHISSSLLPITARYNRIVVETIPIFDNVRWLFWVNMASLKSYTDRLAPVLGISQAMLYERQRRLVRDGVLRPAREGRGPGNGVIASPLSVCYLLIAALSGNDLEGTSVRTTKLAAASKGKVQFRTALVDLLASASCRQTLKGITISQSSAWAQIHYKRSGNLTVTDTFSAGEKRPPPVRILSQIDGEVICDIANWLATEKEPP